MSSKKLRVRKAFKPYSNIALIVGSRQDLCWYSGVYVSKHGIVSVYGDEKYSCFTFVYNGKEYFYSMKKGYTKRGLATIAGRFQREVIEQSKKE